MNNKPTYLCDPKKNVNCPKDICQALGRGECIYTSHPEFAVNPDNPEVVIKVSNEKIYKKKQTNQDKLAEMVRTMDPEHLAEYLSCDIFVCEQNCPICDVYGYDRCPEGISCEEAIVNWLKEDAE